MKSILAATGIGLVFVYVIGSGLWVNTGDNWYRNLNQPPWQPPDFIFGIIWPYNFIILGVAAVTIAQRASTTATLNYLGFFALSVIFALTWAFQFYRPHNLQAASITLSYLRTDVGLPVLPPTQSSGRINRTSAHCFAHNSNGGHCI